MLLPVVGSQTFFEFRVRRVESSMHRTVTRNTLYGLLLSTFGAAALLLTASVSAEASPALDARPSFVNDVLPVLTKAGCNSGACHGAAAGKNGFRLSLRGYDPQGDYENLTREALGRRILPTAPAHSLMLLKPTLAVPHGGGRRFHLNSPEYGVIADWIASGAPGPAPAEPRVQTIEVQPARELLKPGERVQLQVLARYSDGSERDVTRWCLFSSSSDGVASVSDRGLVTTSGHGEAAVSVWFASKVTFAAITVPFDFDLPREVFRRAPRHNFIDDLILKKLEELRLAPSPLAGDGELIRRAYLDTIGVLPTPEEVREFLAATRPDKRRLLFDRLLERSEYVDYWTYKWSDLLLVSSRKLNRSAMFSYYGWIRRSVAENKPWDQFARELVTASGNTLRDGAANFFVIHKDPIELTENVSQAFMGFSLTCARCHDHPLERWTQGDYYGMANLFARVSMKTGNEPGEMTISSRALGEVLHPRLGRPLPPRPLEGESLDLDSAVDRRVHLADWLTSPENPYFARAVVNRVWANFMGRGLVEAVDDLRTTNPASNEELFAALTDEFVRSGFDVKHLIRTILNSAAYQLSSATNESNIHDDRYYSRYFIRRLPAEVILDAVSQVTGIPDEFEGYPGGYRALQLPDSQVESYFLSTFGRPPRVITCDCERQYEPNLAQALHLINGETLNGKLQAEGNIVDSLLEETGSAEELIGAVFWRVLSREPGAAEVARLAPMFSEPDRPDVEDLIWALLTSKEFLFNH